MVYSFLAKTARQEELRSEIRMVKCSSLSIENTRPTPTYYTYIHVYPSALNNRTYIYNDLTMSVLEIDSSLNVKIGVLQNRFTHR